MNSHAQAPDVNSIHRCGHPACSCFVDADGAFCSEACSRAEQSSAAKSTCLCAHAACGATVSESLLEG